jgi:hypothetical protein
MTRALMDIFRSKDHQSTLLAAYIEEVTAKSVKLKWSVSGETPKNYTISMAGKPILNEITGLTCEIPVGESVKGQQTITITANGAHTHYRLSKTELDEISENPLPAEVKLTIKL